MKRTPPPLSCLSSPALACRGRGTRPVAGSGFSPAASCGNSARRPSSRRSAHRLPEQQRHMSLFHLPCATRKLPDHAAALTSCRCTFPPAGAHPAVRPSTLRPSTSSVFSAGTVLPPRRPLTHRLFHTTSPLASTSSDPSHYETLNVPIDASTTEIKKSFYKLSKLHHPDHNPKDPHAPRRFMRISEAYSVLSHNDKRAVYDRDVLRLRPHSYHHAQHHAHTHRPNASYHSTGPAGGRPASGLSRRRTAFKGPPPSFFRNTGSGKGAAYTPGSSSSSRTKKQQEQQQQQQYEQQYGFGPGSVNRDDRGTRSHPSTPHFDYASNERTQRIISDRAAERRAAAAHGAAFATETSTLAGFIIITAAILASAILPPMLFGSHWSTPSPSTVPTRSQSQTSSSRDRDQ